ncbi:MAG: ABC transporter permease, partial [Oscillospiraceae bacterium]
SNPNLPEKYEKYKSGFLERKKDNEKKFNELKYGLENEIVDLDSSTSTRKSVTSVFQFLLVITLLAAIVTGGIVSTEFSKGTIRLLLTRPVSRTKILMSKYATSLFISLIFLVVGTLSVVISSICLYGVGDLSVNMLSFNNGAVTQIPFILWLILKILFSSISIIFVVTASFMLSTLTKNTAVAVGLSVAVSIGSQILTQLLIMSRTFSKIVGYTPIPYINLAEYATDSYLKSMVTQEQRFIFLNENYGAILLLILTAIMLIISIISFKKRDVMN